MGFPASRGGLEMTLEQQVQVVAEIAAVDASAGWNVGVLNAGGFYAGRLAPETFADLYPTTDRPTSGSFHPRGQATQVDGGFMVSGHWDWGSGSYTADHVVGGCLVVDVDGEPVPGSNGQQMLIGAWLPPDAIERLDNWQTLGVRGSGSTSYRITEPGRLAAHTFDREAPFDPTADPLNKTVTACHYALTGVALGVARHAVNLAGRPCAARAACVAGQRHPASPGTRDGRGRLRVLRRARDCPHDRRDPLHRGRGDVAGRDGSDDRRQRDGGRGAPASPPRVHRTGWIALHHGRPPVAAGVATVTRPSPTPAHCRCGLVLHAQAVIDEPARGFTVADDPADGGFRSLRRWSPR